MVKYVQNLLIKQFGKSQQSKLHDNKEVWGIQLWVIFQYEGLKNFNKKSPCELTFYLKKDQQQSNPKTDDSQKTTKLWYHLLNSKLLNQETQNFAIDNKMKFWRRVQLGACVHAIKDFPYCSQFKQAKISQRQKQLLRRKQNILSDFFCNLVLILALHFQRNQRKKRTFRFNAHYVEGKKLNELFQLFMKSLNQKLNQQQFLTFVRVIIDVGDGNHTQYKKEKQRTFCKDFSDETLMHNGLKNLSKDKGNYEFQWKADMKFQSISQNQMIQIAKKYSKKQSEKKQ